MTTEPNPEPHRSRRASLALAIIGNAAATLIASGVGGSIAWKMLDYRQALTEKQTADNTTELRELRSASIDHDARLKVQEAARLRLDADIAVSLRSIQGELQRLKGP